jgi:hypothetical protein
MLSSPGPDYTITVNNPVLTLFPEQEGNFAGQLAALYGYSSPVTVECEANALPDKCAGETVTPTRGGTSYAITARNGSVADFSLNLKATGTDADFTVHRAAVMLHVVDFGLEFAPGTPTPLTITANSGSSTEPVELKVESRGSFNGTVSLACSALPSGATCNFYPSADVNFTSAGSSTVTMTISTLPTTPKTSALPVTISATAAAAPAAKTRSLTLTVKNDPDYQVSAAPDTLSAHPGDTVTARLTLTAVNNYKGTVLASCGTSTLAGTECSLSSNTVYLTNLSSNQVTLTVHLPKTAVAGNYTMGVNTHDLNGSPAHTSFIGITIVPDFVVNLPQATLTVKQGGTAIYNLQVSSLGGAFAGPISFSCTGLPRNTSYSFIPPVVTPGSGTTTVTLRVVTGTVLAAIPSRGDIGALWLAMLLPLAEIMVGLANRRKRGRLGCAAAALLLMFLLGCGGGNGGGSPPILPPTDTATPTGTYTLTVTATSGPVSHSTDVILIVQ